MSKKNIFLLYLLTIQIFVSTENLCARYFSIEGTTGAGKSTLLQLLKEQMPDAEIVPEPVEQTQNIGGQNLLQEYYNNPSRWSYLFQTYAFMLQDELILNATQKSCKKNVLGDRSIYSTFYVFGKMLQKQNMFAPMEWDIYKQWFSYALERSPVRPAGFIYLRTTPEVCFERIKRRNRTEEQEALLEYYADEFYFHEKWLMEKEVDYQWLKDVPVLVLDGDCDFLCNEDILKSMITKIREFIS